MKKKSLDFYKKKKLILSLLLANWFENIFSISITCTLIL